MVSHLNWLNALILSLIFSVQVFATEEVKFTKQKIQIGSKKITVEIANTPQQQQRGLMYREKMAADAGMLFIFDQEQPLNFWMKNTYINLSIAYIGKNKKIVDIQDMKATSAIDTQWPTYPSAKPGMYALEMNQGWFTKNHIKIGDLLVLPRSK